MQSQSKSIDRSHAVFILAGTTSHIRQRASGWGSHPVRLSGWRSLQTCKAYMARRFTASGPGGAYPGFRELKQRWRRLRLK